MNLDKNILDNLAYLDSILDFLIRYCNLQTSVFDNIYNHLHKENSIYNYKNNTVSYSDIICDSLTTISTNVNKDDFQKVKLIEALSYLNKEQFITINGAFTSKITFDGIIKHSKGFVTEYQKLSVEKNRLTNVENFQRKISRQMLWVTCLIALGTLVAMVYYLLEIIYTPYCFCK